MRAAWPAGQRDFGENKVQEALQKIGETADMEIRWHLIGHLQSNKVRKSVGHLAASMSVDSVVSCESSTRRPAKSGGSGRAGSSGSGAGGHEIRRGRRRGPTIVDEAPHRHAVRLIGLMLIPPWHEIRKRHAPGSRLRELRDGWLAEGVPPACSRICRWA